MLRTVSLLLGLLLPPVLTAQSPVTADSGQWRTVRSSTDLAGARHEQRDYFVHGIPVLGGRQQLHFGPGGGLRAVTGRAVRRVSPFKGGADAGAKFGSRAAGALTAAYPDAGGWAVTDAGLHYLAPHLLRPGSRGPAPLARRFDLRHPTDGRGAAVYLDVTTGKPLLTYPLHRTLDREIYDRSRNASRLIWTEGDAFPGTLDAQEQEAIRATGETYNLFFRTFGRDSYDGNGAPLQTVVNRSSNCPNASAYGDFVDFCPGLVTDDVVGHEWTHNYVDASAGLIYRFESGALDEGLADTFGEVIDLLNGRGGDAGATTPRQGCDDAATRWKIGEDVPNFGGTHLRDMYQPECRNDPGHRSSPDFACLPAESDNGGVHINSGLVNRAFVLLVDGGTENGTTVTPIGLTKAAHLYYHALNNYLGPTSDFNDFATALEAGVTDLDGLDLPALTLADAPAAPSGEVFTPADLAHVRAAITATGLAEAPACPTVRALAPGDPAPCTATGPETAFVSLLSQDWENGLGAWAVTEQALHPTTYDPNSWTTSADLPDGRAGTAAFVANLRNGDCVSDLETSLVSLVSPVLPVTTDATLLLEFDHYFSLEDEWDGALLYLSRNGGNFTPLTNAHFTFNGYGDTLNPPNINDNPAAGLGAFTGADQNRLSGSWGTSQVDLTAAGVLPGDDIQLRWTLAVDGCNGWRGWFVDDLRIGFCGNLALPVTFVALAARPDKAAITLNWRTADERDNAGFTVERAGPGQTDFRPIGHVPPGGGPAHDYRFTDPEVAAGTPYYYRIRQRDRDGTEFLSPVVSAQLDPAADGLLAYPNPATGRLFVRLTPGPARTLRLLAADGRPVRQWPTTGGTQPLDLAGLPAGVYWLRAGAAARRVVVR